MGFARFMATLTGRMIRVALGLAMFAIGAWMGNTAGAVVAIIGVVPIIAAVFNVCLIAPLIGAPFLGTKALRPPREGPPAKIEPPSTLAGSH